MEYEIIKKYTCTETTCKELVARLEESNGNVCCVMSAFIDPEYPDDVANVWECWAWIQARYPLKKLYLVEEVESIGRVI